MNSTNQYYLKIKPEDIRKALKYLKEHNNLDSTRNITKHDTWLYLPIQKPIPTPPSNFTGSIEHLTPPIPVKTTYKDHCLIPNHLKTSLPSSFDIIGDILLLKLSQPLLSYKHQIGAALLHYHKHIKVVALGAPVQGEHRLRTIEIIAGEQRTHTVHKEFGINLYVDIQKTYYSPRLGNEHYRIAQLVKPQETIVDLFTGVGPFPIMIAKHATPHHIYAIDNNPDAITLAQKNIQRNKVQHIISLHQGDAASIINLLPKDHPPITRIIMNLPFLAYQYFPQALTIAHTTCRIHYYEILTSETLKERIQTLTTTAQQQGYALEVMQKNIIKSYSPREIYIGIDIRVKHTADVA